MPIFDIFKRATGAGHSGARLQRTSSGLAELDKVTKNIESMTVLNLGPTSPGNIAYFTNLGHGIYSEDIITAAADDHYRTETEDGSRFDVERFLKENLVPNQRKFDIAICWDVFDYIDDALLAPLAHRIYELLKENAYLLAFFHSKTGEAPPPYYRYHITGPGTLDMQPGPNLTLRRTLNNRKIEDILTDFSSRKFLLARDNMREVLARK
ncbi:MAG: SAM-dependent methyltransferase [Acidobacteriales bacterium]|nr:SAM-dependent methyltransferase [Terriglobales bacterium]